MKKKDENATRLVGPLFYPILSYLATLLTWFASRGRFEWAAVRRSRRRRGGRRGSWVSFSAAVRRQSVANFI